MVDKEYINKMLALSHWKTEFQSEETVFPAVFLGKFRKNLVFETTKLRSTFKLKSRTFFFKIFLPSMIVSGKGTCIKSGKLEGLKHETIMRFMVSPSSIRVKQKRHYKRFPVLEQIVVTTQDQEIKGLMKDISISGIGMIAGDRIRSSEGNLYIKSAKLDIHFHKVHEFTDFNFFQYGMTIEEDIKENIERLKQYLLTIKKKLDALNIEI